MSKGKIEIRRWDVLDIFYYEEDEKNVDLIIKEFINKGWTDAQYGDACNKDYDMSVQLTKLHQIKTKKIPNEKR